MCSSALVGNQSRRKVTLNSKPYVHLEKQILIFHINFNIYIVGILISRLSNFFSILIGILILLNYLQGFGLF